MTFSPKKKSHCILTGDIFLFYFYYILINKQKFVERKCRDRGQEDSSMTKSDVDDPTEDSS